MPFDDEKKIKRLKEKEANLISRATKAMDEGRDKRVDRLVPRAVRVQNRIITLEEKGKIPMKNAAIDKLGNYPRHLVGSFTTEIPTIKEIPDMPRKPKNN
jgi:hypothetical protein